MLTIAAIGVVYGDIGTSPLYTMKAVFSKEYGLPLNEMTLLGVVSLIFWGLVVVVSLKYVTLVLRADNGGEGGVMALLSLASNSVKKKSDWQYPLILIGLFGASLFYGDGIITPAISVLSAVEGLEIAAPALKHYVVPLTVIILVTLYAVQRKGSAQIGKWFGPIMLLWFMTLAIMGIVNIIQAPVILAALNPIYAVRFIVESRWLAFVALGAVVLALTGAEALYADMGHFGKRPIRVAWFLIVFPALILNYFGQGALLLSNPEAISNPFYQMLGSWSIYPLVVLSTMATVIASQSTISGTFSVTQQAISLGVLPRMRVIYTSEHEIGQVYLPLVNWLQLTAVVIAVIGFGSSDSLAAAYGIAVTGTMLTTTVLTFFVIYYGWNYNLIVGLLATGFFLVIDVVLFSANTLKIVQGGWLPLLLGIVMLTIMLTWRTGRKILFDNLQANAILVNEFQKSLLAHPPPIVEGTAIFFRSESEGIPHAMLHNLSHNKVLHERVVFLTAINVGVPMVPLEERVNITTLGHNWYQINVYYGFKDERDIPQALSLCNACGLTFNMMETSFFIARQNVIPTIRGGMALWREGVFAAMHRNARDAADYYHVPSNRVIELGTQIEI